jgi:hypothetical protein
MIGENTSIDRPTRQPFEHIELIEPVVLRNIIRFDDW